MQKIKFDISFGGIVKVNDIIKIVIFIDQNHI